ELRARLRVREGLRGGLVLEGPEDEAVGEELVAVDLRVVPRPDEVPLLVSGLRVGEREPDRHEERVSDEEREVEERGRDERVPERGLALEETRTRPRGVGGQSASSVAGSKR